MAKKASEDLSPAGMAYVIAIMQKDKAQMDTLQSQIEPSESMTVALFMPQAAAQCAPQHTRSIKAERGRYLALSQISP